MQTDKSKKNRTDNFCALADLAPNAEPTIENGEWSERKIVFINILTKIIGEGKLNNYNLSRDEKSQAKRACNF